MELDKVIGGFRDGDFGVRWVKAANLHVTLRFLGDIAEESLPHLIKTIKDNIYGFGGFDLSLKSLGGFPSLKIPQVIWVGTGWGAEKLKELAVQVEMSCIEAKFGRSDKRFSSHITIGRIKSTKGLSELTTVVGKTIYESPVFKVGEIVIFKSDLSPSGPSYTKLETISL